MAKIGVSGFHYAKNTKDDAAGVTYAAPVAVKKLKEIIIKTASDTVTDYADNGPSEVASSLGEITVEISLSDLTLEDQAALLGHTIAEGVMTYNADDTAPDVAIGFVGLKSNGKKRYVWLLKGKFQEPDDTYKTKGDKIEFQPQALTGKFVIRDFDGDWKKLADEDATGFLPETATNWFTTETIQATV